MKQFFRFAVFLLTLEIGTLALTGHSENQGAAYYFGYWILAPALSAGLWVGYNAICDLITRKLSGAK